MKAKKKAVKKITAKKTKKVASKAKTKKTTKKLTAERTHILAVVDKSSSMNRVRDAAITGFNKFLGEQKKLKDKATMNVVLFSDHNKITPLYNDQILDVTSVDELTKDTYIPLGSTALNDAIVSSMTSLKLKIDTMKPSKRPQKVLVIIVTDGEENDSREYPQSKVDQVKNLILKRKEENWQFMFLCSTEEAAFTGQNLGVSAGNIFQYSNDVLGNDKMFSKMSFGATSFRSVSLKSKNYDKMSNNLLAEDDTKDVKPSLTVPDLDDQNS